MMLTVISQVRKKNVLKDFVSVAGELGVSHFLIYTKSDINVHLRVCRLSRGPTLTFRVQDYTLCRDVVSALKKPNMDPKQFNHHPLLVMNNFSGGEMHIKLMSTMFQNMFPSININKVRTFRMCMWQSVSKMAKENTKCQREAQPGMHSNLSFQFLSCAP